MLDTLWVALADHMRWHLGDFMDDVQKSKHKFAAWRWMGILTFARVVLNWNNPFGDPHAPVPTLEMSIAACTDIETERNVRYEHVSEVVQWGVLSVSTDVWLLEIVPLKATQSELSNELYSIKLNRWFYHKNYIDTDRRFNIQIFIYNSKRNYFNELK